MSRWTVTLLAFSWLLAALTVAGCNLAMPIAYIVGGLPPTPAAYTLPKNKMVLVYIDDRHNRVSPANLRQIIAQKASEELMVQNLVRSTIEPRDAIAIVRRESHKKPMAIDEIGKEVGAELVIYVEMEAFAITPDGYTPQPTAICQIRVIDVEQRVRLFPPDGAQPPTRSLEVKLPQTASDRYNTPSGRRELQNMLANEIGDRISKLFYEHVANDIGSKLNPND